MYILVSVFETSVVSQIAFRLANIIPVRTGQQWGFVNCSLKAMRAHLRWRDVCWRKSVAWSFLCSMNPHPEPFKHHVAYQTRSSRAFNLVLAVWARELAIQEFSWSPNATIDSRYMTSVHRVFNSKKIQVSFSNMLQWMNFPEASISGEH